jgi:hypothetical protein
VSPEALRLLPWSFVFAATFSAGPASARFIAVKDDSTPSRLDGSGRPGRAPTRGIAMANHDRPFMPHAQTRDIHFGNFA